MHPPDRVRVVRVALRVSLAAAFLSAVADGFGWWEPLGQGSWGSMSAFAAYTHQLVAFASGRLLTVIVWAATATEATLGVLLLTGWRPKLVGAATCLVLVIFGSAMAVSLGMESPLSYSVSPRQARLRPKRYLAQRRLRTTRSSQAVEGLQ
jgi:uncharacterized membrane protein YphA (DoxX/SURF4 family)